MSVQQFTGASVLSTLNQNLETSNYQSMQITNNSNYGFTLISEPNSVTVGYINPWENMIMPLDGISTLKIQVNTTLNIAHPFTPIQSQEMLQVQLSRLSVTATTKTSSAILSTVQNSLSISGTINGTVNVGNTVNTSATITNEPTFNISSGGNTVSIGSSVPLSTTVTNSPDVNIASIASGATVNVGNTVNTSATITNEPTFNISSSGNQVVVSNTVTTSTEITNEPTMNISSSGNTIEVGGQIKNSTITMSQAYSMECDFSLSDATSATVTQAFYGENQLTNVLRGKLYLYSPNGYNYLVTITPVSFLSSNTLYGIPQDNSITVTGATSQSGAGQTGSNTSDFYWQRPQQCNGFQITIENSSAVTENPIMWLIFDGNANPLENSFLGTDAYNFLQADTAEAGVSVAGSANGNHAFPVSLYTVDSLASPITNTQIGENNPLFVQQVTSAGFPVSSTNPFPIYPSDYAYGMGTFGGGPPPTSTAYTTTDSGVHAIQGIFATFVNTATTRQFVNLVFQNNNDTSQTFTILVQVGIDGTTVLNWTFAHPWAPFGSGGNLNFGWNQPNSDAVYGAAYAQYSNGN